MSLRWARDYAAGRRLAAPDADMNRLYVVETMLTTTGSLADHRLAVRPADVARVGAAVLAQLIALGRRPPQLPAGAERALTPLARQQDARWASAVARDLAQHAGASIAIAGD